MMLGIFKDPNMQRSIREIGSEFWIDNVPASMTAERDGLYTISGRTAIDLILQDILKKRPVKNVAMPAWCCESMIAPFVAHGIMIEFYDICHTEITDDTDVFYLTNYFGYENTLPLGEVKTIKEQGSIILYDRTHSFLMDDESYIQLADYCFASIRKWMGVIGGAVVEGVNDYCMKPCPYLSCKEEAMRIKKAFIEGVKGINKQAYLKLFSEFGHHLAVDYRDYEMDDLSYALYKDADLRTIRERRRENAAYLHKHLKGVRFLGKFTERAVPLFVPVLFETKEQRNYVRKKLIEASIYCPIHWPKPTQIPTDFDVNNIYNTELSLICDQRYNLTDMDRLVTLINGL